MLLRWLPSLCQPLLPSLLSPLPLLLLVLLLLGPVALGQHSVLMDGDLVLGGLFPVHEKGEGTPCSAKLYNRGLQRLEAMLFAVDQINADRRLLPHAKIGVNILDTCSTDTYALNQSLAYIKAPLDVMDTVAFECTDGSRPRLKYRSKAVSGVVGASYSTISINAANLFRLFRIPQISPASTAKALSDKSRFEFFARTVPPDTFQATALVDMVQLFNWSYVSTIASEGSYGESGMDAFHRQAAERNICIAVSEKVPRDATAKTFDTILTRLLQRPNARGVILFVRAGDARGVLAAAKRLRLEEPFHWIASDGWGKQESLLEGVEDVAEGAITVELTSRHIPAFDRYMAALTPDTNRRNPWFREYWQAFFGCSLQAGGAASNTSSSIPACDPALRLRPEAGFVQESKVQFVIDAVYAFAHALEKLQLDVCGVNLAICKEMRQYDGGDFYKNYILNVSFTDMAGSKVMFDERGDGMARYTIFNYQRDPATGQHQYKMIGQWELGQLNMSASSVRWNRAIRQRKPTTSPPDLTSDRLTSESTPELSSGSAFELNSDPSSDPSPDLSAGLSGELAYNLSYDLLSDASLNTTEPYLGPANDSSADTSGPVTSEEPIGVTSQAPEADGGGTDDDENEVPVSVCSLPCGVGEVKLMQQDDSCSWICL